jgi:hypothetical protein
MKKYPATQEMANVFPPYTRVRQDDQSVGYTLLNTLAKPMDKMDKSVHTMRKNFYLSTVNLDEIDLLYRIILPRTFEFDEEDDDPLTNVPTPPTVVGNPDTDAYTVTLADGNSLENFWYKSLPNRVEVADIQSDLSHELLSMSATESPLDVDLTHHLRGGRLWIETSGGVQYLTVANGELRRGRVILTGVTRKGTEESETIIFPWNMKQASQKEWKSISKIRVMDMEDTVTVTLMSGDFDSGPYLDHYNLRYSPNRRKIDTFWNLGTVGTLPTLDMVEYISDEWETLALGFDDKNTVQSWELIDNQDIPVTGIDMAVQPFSDRAWIIGNDDRLHLFELSEDMVSGVDSLVGRTAGSHVQFEYDTRYFVKDEEFVFTPWHARPLKEILAYQMWYQTPSGTKYGILNGAQVSYSSDFSVVGQQLKRTIADQVTIPLTERGEYLFVLEADFIDGDTHTEKIIVKTNYKRPLATIDISSLIPYTISGIDFDSDQKPWLWTSGGYYKIESHTDVMLIDYEKKIIYFKEEYDDVDITTSS